MRLHETNVEATSANLHLGKVLEHVLGDRRRESDERMVVTNVDAIDFAAVQIALVRQRTDDVARLHPVPPPHLETKEGLRALGSARTR